MSVRTRVCLILLGLLLLALLAWRSPTPSPAASNAAITPLLLGSLSGSATTTPGPADALFTTLASSAGSSIDVAMYDFDRATVRDALLAAQQRGVVVRVVADGEDAADPQYAPFYGNLLSAGIPVVTDTLSSLMHNKFAVFDKHVTWTGSANFTDTGFTFNGENVLVITDTVIAGAYHTEFEEMFGGTFSTNKTDNTVHSATIGGAAVELAFAPTDSVQQRIINTLNTANTSIQVAMFTFTNDALGDALIAAHSRGVQVEVLLDQFEANVVGGERDRLCAAGVTVRVENFAAKIHDKYAVVDAGTTSDPLIVGGSANWTASAVDANDENLLIIHDAGLATDYAADFARLRSAIMPGGFTCNVAPQTTATPTATQTPTPTATPTPTLTASPTATSSAAATATPIRDSSCDLIPGSCTYLPLIQRTDVSLPDLTIASMTISLDTTCLSPGSRLGLRVTVANIGNAAAGPFALEANGAQQTISGGLGAGQSTTLWFGGYNSGAPNTATADATALVAERNETNNQLSQMLPIPTPPLPCPATPTATRTPLPTSTPTSTPTATTMPGDTATITFIRYNPPDTLSEYVQIQNTGGATLNMTNWTLSDVAGHTYTFPAFTLAAGASVKIWTNGGTNDSANLYWGRAQAVWNNTGDTAFLRNAQGELVDQYSY
jgi:phosphatidylserine/phosphatidylglycerophosphate/cardiolipin synthase-like enzyme